MPRKPRADASKYKTFAFLAYKKHAGNIEAGLKNRGYFLENDSSDREHNFFYNPAADFSWNFSLPLIYIYKTTYTYPFH